MSHIWANFSEVDIFTWRRIESEVVRDEREEPVGRVDKLDLTSASGLDHLEGFRQNLVSGFDLFPAQLSERHLLGVDLKLHQRFLHLLQVIVKKNSLPLSPTLQKIKLDHLYV